MRMDNGSLGLGVLKVLLQSEISAVTHPVLIQSLFPSTWILIPFSHLGEI